MTLVYKRGPILRILPFFSSRAILFAIFLLERKTSGN